MKKSMGFMKFFSYLGTDIRKWEVIYSLLPVIPYVILYHQISNYQIKTYGPIIVSSLFLLILIGSIVKRLKDRLGKDCEDCSTTELFEMAKKLDPNLTENPIRITVKEDFLAETRGHKIILGKKYLENLDCNEKIFVIGHELFHYRNKGESYGLLMVVGMIFFIISLIWVSGDVMIVILFAVFFRLLWALTRRSIESLADCQGVQFSNNNAAINPLNIRYEIKKTILFDSHPRHKIRMKNIEKKCSKT